MQQAYASFKDHLFTTHKAIDEASATQAKATIDALHSVVYCAVLLIAIISFRAMTIPAGLLWGLIFDDVALASCLARWASTRK